MDNSNDRKRRYTNSREEIDIVDQALLQVFAWWLSLGCYYGALIAGPLEAYRLHKLSGLEAIALSVVLHIVLAMWLIPLFINED
jgi:hypothetical protein